MSTYLITTRCYEAKLFTDSVIDREQLLTEMKETGSKKNTQLENRTPVQVFDLEIVAEDRGTPKRRSKAKINLLVTDENDEHPVFLLPKPDQTAIKLSQYEPVHSEFLQVLAVDRDEGPNGTVQYFMGNIGIYDFGRTEVDSNRCNAGWVKYKPITTRMGINLHEYFYMNSSTGKLRLARELPSKLVGHVCIITIVARDMGPFDRLETSLNICVKITDSPSRQINGSIAGYLRRAPQQRTLFYLYIVTGVLVSVLTLSITFVLAAYCLWYRGNVSNDKHLSNAIHYSEGELRPEETHRDANDFIYRIDGLGATTANLRDWSASEHPADFLQTIPTNFQPGTPDLSYNPLIGNAKGMTSRNRPDFNGALVPSVQANSSVYYTLTNTHALYSPPESTNQLR
ncbi:long-chain fatty acid transporter fat1 [Clonorchis sinensis]|uniref:Long-chain fatty acid transporter fat1 n=1 Tax=Clonorchis sinensis TaxID=79923 RepID=A0A8T1M726_CLOSI|nr:long-chain fatty acid transporter fat1 [Clonorchis sinensis]